MNKTWLIIKREYITRVKNKTFLLSTFLMPILFVGLIAAVTFITVKSSKEEKIAVGDKVSVEPYLNCGECQSCQNGKSNCCEKLQVLGVHTDGGMCEYIKIPANK